MKSRGDRWARGAGIALGLTIAGGALLSWRIPPGTGTLGTDVIIASQPSGEIAVTPTGPFVSGIHMEPGAQDSGSTGTIKVRNQTGRTLQVHLRGLPSTVDLDALLWVQIDAGERELFRGPVGGLRAWTLESFSLRPGQRQTVSVQTWLPSSVQTGYEGRIATVDLEFESIPVGA